MSVLEEIVLWNESRNLKDFKPHNEYALLFEELMEFQNASISKNESEQVDALCDIIVVATGALHKLGYSPDKAMDETLKEINSRKGSINENTGKWEKDITQDPETLYKANYSTCKI